jgi:hypothetical protein
VNLTKYALILVVNLMLVATSVAAESPGTNQTDNGFAPGLLLMLLVVVLAVLVLIGFGMAVGTVCIACAAIFVALGVVSSSALVALWKRRFSAGLRALHYQLSALIGLPCGIGVFWAGCLLLNLQLRHRYILAVGSLIGVTMGVLMAFILDRFCRFLFRRFFPTTSSQISS